jgi:hypothetical protein
MGEKAQKVFPSWFYNPLPDEKDPDEHRRLHFPMSSLTSSSDFPNWRHSSGRRRSISITGRDGRDGSSVGGNKGSGSAKPIIRRRSQVMETMRSAPTTPAAAAGGGSDFLAPVRASPWMSPATPASSVCIADVSFKTPVSSFSAVTGSGGAAGRGVAGSGFNRSSSSLLRGSGQKTPAAIHTELDDHHSNIPIEVKNWKFPGLCRRLEPKRRLKRMLSLFIFYFSASYLAFRSFVEIDPS